ncbi:MAG: hypothetical protein U5K76_15375 [Woeseiaceae bacterium]|nr:hypothetical protein [Woeseiaceae bacterium]
MAARVSARAGYDDNVILQDETGLAGDVSAESPFLEVFGTLRGPYPGWRGVRLDGSFYMLRYPEAGDFNQASANLGALYEWWRGDWSADAGMHLATTTLGGDGFDRSLRLSTRITRRLTPDSSVALRYRHDDVSAIESIYDGIEGSRHRVDLQFRWSRDDRRVGVNLTRETNDRADPSVSPDKLKLEVDYRFVPETGWGYGVGMELRSSEYAGIDPSRDEDLVQFDARVTRYTESGWQLFAELLRADNDSSDAAFSYERNQLAIGVYRLF